MLQPSYSTPLLALDAVVLDTETTGLDARTARVVQIAAIRLIQGNLHDEQRFDTLINPGIPIPKAVIAIHGITDEAVGNAPTFAKIAPDLEAFAGRSIIVGHTIHYDLAVLEREYGFAGRRWPGFRALDVRTLAQIAAPSLAEYSLDHLCTWLGIESKARHSAAGDAEAAGRIFVALLPLLRAKNVRTLAEAEAASRALAEREALTTGGRMPVSPAEPAHDTRALARIDSFPYRHLVRDVMTAPALFAQPGASLRETLRLMIEKRTSSVFVRTTSGATGIVTERDLLRAIDAEAPLSTPVENIMNAPLQTVSENAFLYRAIGRIQRLGFRHLGVRNAAGEIVGAVTTRNLLGHRAATAIALGDEIDSAPTPAALAAAWAKLPLVARSLIEEAVDPRTIATVVSSEICIMTRRAAQLAEARLLSQGAGPPPVPYAVLVLGSAGRGESQLAADQDNAIVYAHGAEHGPEDAYFAELGAIMSDILDAAGVTYCRGGVMARNREWRKSLADWRVTIDGWVRRQDPADLLNVDIFFDAVPVHGELQLGETVWNYAYERGHAAPDFQNLLIEVARQRERPFTLLGGFRVNENGRIDLKRLGLMPIFTSARVLSIRHDVRARPTVDRLAGVSAKGVGAPEVVQSILDAHRILLGAVIAQQLADVEAGVPLSARIAPARLDKSQSAELKRALQVTSEAVGLVSEGRL